MKTAILSFLLLTTALIFTQSSFAALCPDGSYVNGNFCVRAPDGSYTGGDSPTSRISMTPDRGHVTSSSSSFGLYNRNEDNVRCPNGTYAKNLASCDPLSNNRNNSLNRNPWSW